MSRGKANFIELLSVEVVFRTEIQIKCDGKAKEKKREIMCSLCHWRRRRISKMPNHLKSMTRPDSHDFFANVFRIFFVRRCRNSEKVETNKTSISAIKLFAFLWLVQCQTDAQKQNKKRKIIARKPVVS